MPATAVHAYVPDRCDNLDGEQWMSFLKDGSYETFSHMPEVLTYQGHYYKRMSHNSDTGWIHYKEVHVSKLAMPSLRKLVK